MPAQIPWWWILYWCVYGALWLTIIVFKICKVGAKRRGVVKMLTSVSFVAASVYGAVRGGNQFSALLCVGLCFASLGDLFLVFRHIADCFVYGVVCFLVASVLISVYSILSYGFAWWAPIPYVAFLVFNFLAQKFKLYSYGRHKVCLNSYVCSVSFCGCLGLTIFCRGTADLTMFLFGLGCFCYFVSDVFLGLFLYKFRSRFVDATNSLFYYPGMLFIGSSGWFSIVF